jgi:hypothetical protein
VGKFPRVAFFNDLRQIGGNVFIVFARLRGRTAAISGHALPVKTVRNAGYCFYAQARVEAKK